MNVETATYKLEMLMAYLAQTFPVATQCQPTRAAGPTRVELGDSRFVVEIYTKPASFFRLMGVVRTDPRSEMPIGTFFTLWEVARAVVLGLVADEMDAKFDQERPQV